MKILFTIPHYYNPQSNSIHGAWGRDPTPRIDALARCISALHDLYGRSQRFLDFDRRAAWPANEICAHEVHIMLVTTGNFHLVEQLPLSRNDFYHHSTSAEPLMLGFECQALLNKMFGQYDYYCYLEDDNILHDPWFFIKLAWFTAKTGPTCLLQPNRYEVTVKGYFEIPPHGIFRKTYVDGEIPLIFTEKYQNINEDPFLEYEVMGVRVVFLRTTNPHSGCYFLNAEQMDIWRTKPYFLRRDAEFIGPLESAATLGIMRTFKVYKPARECASFLEIQHFGDQSARWADGPPPENPFVM